MKASDAAASRPDSHPDQRKITSLQAKRLSALTGLKRTDFENHSIAQLAERLKWQIDPALFLFRRICGKVVKKDATTGEYYPVPFATVYVEDTDCSLISYFPKAWPWSWHFPFFCHREVIGSTKTDECGNFCVWIPRFDIDWILRWRHSRICFPLIFRRPEIAELLPKIPVPVDGPWPPIPDPDPGPYRTLTTLAPSIIEAAAGVDARRLAERVARFQSSSALGGTPFAAEELTLRAFEKELPPPLPAEFHNALSGQGLVAAKGASAVEGIRSAVAMKAGIDAKALEGFDLRRVIGPFYRCYDVVLPEWQPILDVPDITFRVGQDVNGDGTEETIYSEGFFDVRWDAGALPNVTLVANSSARETRLCNAPPIQCGNVPALVTAGHIPLGQPSYFDAGTGYMVRTNRPSADGVTPPTSTSTTAATAPFCLKVSLRGCVEINQAKYYRVLQSVDGGATFSAITGAPAWNNFRKSDNLPVLITADTSGWYPVDPLDAANNPIPRQALADPNLLLEWDTPTLGQVILKLETGNAAKAHLAFSANVPFQLDNTAPTIHLTQLAWKFTGEPDSALRSLLGTACPTIHRHVTPANIELVFEAQVLANHLRDAGLGASGCGSGGSFTPVSAAVDPATLPYHWHTSAADNAVLLHQRYTLAAAAPEGAYTFSCGANSRAVNPQGIYGENLVPPDWNTNVVYLYAHTSIAVAVVNAN